MNNPLQQLKITTTTTDSENPNLKIGCSVKTKTGITGKITRILKNYHPWLYVVKENETGTSWPYQQNELITTQGIMEI